MSAGVKTKTLRKTHLAITHSIQMVECWVINTNCDESGQWRRVPMSDVYPKTLCGIRYDSRKHPHDPDGNVDCKRCAGADQGVTAGRDE